MSDLDYTNNLWELDSTHNPVVDDLAKQKQFAFQVWREDFKNSRTREDSKKSDIKDAWTDIYQLIGFFNVFQGVWFQGVTQLATQRTCRFSIVPILLSVLVSSATIVGVYNKLSKVRTLQIGLYRDKLDSKKRESRITACGREGLKFDIISIETKAQSSVTTLAVYFEEQLERAHRSRVIVLALLTIVSGLFAWLIYAIMCDKYH